MTVPEIRAEIERLDAELAGIIAFCASQGLGLDQHAQEGCAQLVKNFMQNVVDAGLFPAPGMTVKASLEWCPPTPEAISRRLTAVRLLLTSVDSFYRRHLDGAAGAEVTQQCEALRMAFLQGVADNCTHVLLGLGEHKRCRDLSFFTGSHCPSGGAPN